MWRFVIREISQFYLKHGYFSRFMAMKRFLPLLLAIHPSVSVRLSDCVSLCVFVLMAAHKQQQITPQRFMQSKAIAIRNATSKQPSQ